MPFETLQLGQVIPQIMVKTLSQGNNDALAWKRESERRVGGIAANVRCTAALQAT